MSGGMLRIILVDIEIKHPDVPRCFTVVVDIVERSVTTFFCSYVCFCNLRCLVQYLGLNKSASKITKMTTLFNGRKSAYTTTMSFLVSPTPAPQPKNKNIQSVRLIFAGLLVLLLTSQLFMFEKFPDVIDKMSLPWSTDAAPLVWAALVVVLETAALPFLLLMPLSRAARAVSMIAGWMVVVWWMMASLWLNMTGESLNSGFLGATLDVPSGWWTVPFSLALAALAGWSAWGMWPFEQKRQRAR